MTGYSPDSSGAIQARLAYLRLRKEALDDLIQSLERYSAFEIPIRKKARPEQFRQVTTPRLAGAA